MCLGNKLLITFQNKKLKYFNIIIGLIVKSEYFLSINKKNVLVNFLFRYISPKYHASAEYKVNCSCWFCAVDDGGHFMMI